MDDRVSAPGARLDDTGFGGIKILQDPGDFCYGVDAVILAHFASECVNARVKTRAVPERAADLGCGTGIIPLIMSHKTSVPYILGIEVQERQADLAARNADMNGLSGRIEIMRTDVTDVADGSAEIPGAGTFYVVTTNPPYVENGSGLINDSDSKHIARHETTAGLREFTRAAARLLAPRGDLFMIHRPQRLADIFMFMRECSLEPKELRMICPRGGAAPNMALIRAVKGGGKELRVLPELYVYGSDGAYSREIETIYERLPENGGEGKNAYSFSE